MTTVNEINMAKWIVALRSGKYRQTKGKLRARLGGGMCCLGVACDISGLGKWEPSESDTDRRLYVVGDREEDGEALPPSVAQWLFGDIQADANPSLKNPRAGKRWGDEVIHCAEANDDAGLKFPAIADALEVTYLPGKKAEEVLAVQS